MTALHGKATVFFLAGYDLGQFANNSQLKLTPDSHDLTVYGKNSHIMKAGLKAGKLTVSGFYDTTAVSGPRAVIMPLIGTSDLTFIHRAEGTGAGRPQDTGLCIITDYTQTHPVADYVTWSVDLTLSDDINSNPQ